MNIDVAAGGNDALIRDPGEGEVDDLEEDAPIGFLMINGERREIVSVYNPDDASGLRYVLEYGREISARSTEGQSAHMYASVTPTLWEANGGTPIGYGTYEGRDVVIHRADYDYLGSGRSGMGNTYIISWIDPVSGQRIFDEVFQDDGKLETVCTIGPESDCAEHNQNTNPIINLDDGDWLVSQGTDDLFYLISADDDAILPPPSKIPPQVINLGDESYLMTQGTDDYFYLTSADGDSMRTLRSKIPPQVITWGDEDYLMTQGTDDHFYLTSTDGSTVVSLLKIEETDTLQVTHFYDDGSFVALPTEEPIIIGALDLRDGEINDVANPLLSLLAAPPARPNSGAAR
jgi:hypothetical protein